MAFIRLLYTLQILSLALLAIAAPSSLESHEIVKRTSSGKSVSFTIDLRWADLSPVGGPTRKMILTNGTVPGPALKINVGDKVNFLVHNNLPNETTIHFHGIEQLHTAWSDGTPGLSQKPIAPGKSYMYKWTASESGTYFYHAHYKGQIMDGLYGAIIIQPREAETRPFWMISSNPADRTAMRAAEKLNKPVFISDYSQYTSKEFYDIQAAANVDNACADSIIINGKGSVYCLSREEITTFTSPKLPPLLASINPPQLTDKACLPPNLVATQGNYTFNLDALPANAYYSCTPSTGSAANIMVDPVKKWAALTFINVGGFSTMKFTIDSHKLYVYAVDGRYITPQFVDQVTVNNGDRYSVMVKLDQQVGQYAIRVVNNGLNQVISGFGVLNYVGSVGPSSSATSVMNFAGVNTTVIRPFNDTAASPYPPVAPAKTADATFKFLIEKLDHAYTWTLAGKEAYNMTNEDAAPLLMQKPTNVPSSDLVIKTNKGQWVDLIVEVAGPLAQPHPMHKHSNKMFLLGSGIGAYNYSTVAEGVAAMPDAFNLVNPPYRDGFTSKPAERNSSWMALRYHVLNPGAFLFHCHMQTHLSGGMAITMLDGVDAWPNVPAEYANGGNGILQKKTT